MHRPVHPLFAVLGFAVGLACGGEDIGGSEGGTQATATSGTDDTTATTGESTTTAGPGSESDGSTGSSTSTTDPQDTSSTGPDTGTTGEPPPQYDGPPLPEEPPGDWFWVDFPAASCIDGSNTGIGVRYGISDELVIFFEGGGGCFNQATCGLFYTSFAHFDELIFDVIWQNTILQGGLFSTSNSDNPVRDWNFIYVPYCTGDVHAGDSPDTPVPGFQNGAPQQFVGYRNMGEFLDRIVPTFSDTSHVLVTGISAGGFGAAFNYDRIADAFPDSKVTLIDDSGPPLTDPYLVPCMQQQWRELYKLDDTLPADCDACFQPDGGGIYNLGAYIADKHSEQTLGLISSERDLIIRTFFGYGVQGEGGEQCPAGIFELPMNGAYFEEGLYTLRDELKAFPGGNFASYFKGGTSHTNLSFPAYYLTTVNGIRMVDWVSNLLEGQTSHVSP